MARIKPQHWHRKRTKNKQSLPLPCPNRLLGRLRPRPPQERDPDIVAANRNLPPEPATERTEKPQEASVDLFSTLDTWRAGRRLGWREWSVLAVMVGWVLWVLFLGERDISFANKCSMLFLFLIIMVVGYLVSAVTKK